MRGTILIRHPGARALLARSARCGAPMPPDPVAWRDRSRGQGPADYPGARALLARSARCGAPMPPDPVAWRDRSRGQAPLVVRLLLVLGLLVAGCGGPSADELFDTEHLNELQHNPTHARE